MKTKEIQSLMICFSMVLLSACSGSLNGVIAQDKTEPLKPPPLVISKMPDWVLGKGHFKYPQDQYLVGLGFSEKNTVLANESARSELAKSMRVNIRSTMKDVATMEWTHIEAIVETEINAILEGVEIKDGLYDGRTYYAFAVLSRRLVASMTRERIKSIQSGISGFMHTGDEATSRGEILAAFSAYFAGYRNASSLLPLKSALRVITHSNETTKPDGFSENDFASKIQGIVQNLKLETVSGDGQSVKSYNELAKPLVIKLYLQRESRPIPVTGVPLIFKYEKGTGELESSKTSDASGQASSRIHKITSFEEEYHTVVVKLDFQKIISGYSPELIDRFFTPLRNLKTSFTYSIKKVAWATGKSQAWKNGIVDLVNQIIRNLPPTGRPVLGVVEFKDSRFGRKTAFAEILREDFKNVLARAENLTVKEVIVKDSKSPATTAQSNGLNHYITGFYRMEKGGLELSAQLTDTGTQRIISTGNTQISRSEMNADDLTLLMDKGDSDLSSENYDDNLEKLLSAKPQKSAINVRVWTDKKEYQIGDHMTFNLKTDVDSYVTLLDIDSGGNITVIFPNNHTKDNFIRGGADYQVSAEVRGPQGLERIKAIATVNPGLPINLNLQQVFHFIDRETNQGPKDIKALADKFAKNSRIKWGETSSELFIFNKGETYLRGSRKIP